MDYEKIKRDANDILRVLSCECSYIEYKTSSLQLAKILKPSARTEITTMIMIYCIFFWVLKK